MAAALSAAGRASWTRSSETFHPVSGYTPVMRVFLAFVVAVIGIWLGADAGAGATPLAGGARTPQSSLVRALRGSLRAAGPHSGAYVVDLNTGQALFSAAATTGRLPASVEKLYTTSTALLRFGPSATLTTSILGVGTQGPGGTFSGTLYLRGGGDPSFGAAAFDRRHYGGGATLQRLVANLVRQSGITALNGRVVADESWFDSLRGTPATDYAPSFDVEGALSGLAYDRGWASLDGSAYDAHPARVAGQQLLNALRAAGVRVGARTPLGVGAAPAGARLLSDVHSPQMATLIKWTNAPSDNFFAEMLLKDLGARFGGAGTTSAGAAVVMAQVATSFAIHPRFDDGSGLSYYDRTTPEQVVSLLQQMAGDPPFVASLAVAGETGTLQDEMQGTYAQGRCRGKTGTLQAVSNVAGYCRARDGHTLAYAFLMNSIDPNYAHPIQDRMQVALARYDG
jgi:D-alanyl-D-alanine carboxypeptidase/D-alanyl-D-alanine-endopeptidase (penicillin-binding protein 4)